MRKVIKIKFSRIRNT